MNFLWNHYIADWIITLACFLAVYGFLFFMYAKIVKRKTGYVFVSVTFAAN